MADRIVLLASDAALSRMVYHALIDRFGDVGIIIEENVPRTEVLRRRVKKLGLTTVVGQVLFMALVLPILSRTGGKRIEAIQQAHGLDDSPLSHPVTKVPSVNSTEARQALQELNPHVVVVYGTRVIRDHTLRAIDAPFVNVHSGITPLYRGVHGGYWALAEGRSDLVGTTVHLVDLGIDTGDVIAQATFSVTREDNFATYPHLHLAGGLPILLEAVQQSLDGRLSAKRHEPGSPSVLRTHPTLWGYLIRRLLNGVR